MGCHKADAAKQVAWRSSGKRPPCPQWHLLGLAIGSTLARSTGGVWPYTTCDNRFVRWRRAGVWSRIIDALAAAHEFLRLAFANNLEPPLCHLPQERGDDSRLV